MHNIHFPLYIHAHVCIHVGLHYNTLYKYARTYIKLFKSKSPKYRRLSLYRAGTLHPSLQPFHYSLLSLPLPRNITLGYIYFIITDIAFGQPTENWRHIISKICAPPAWSRCAAPTLLGQKENIVRRSILDPFEEDQLSR